MTKNEIDMIKAIDSEALAYYGRGFIRLPRSIVNRQFSFVKKESKVGYVLFALFCLCKYDELQEDENSSVNMTKMGEWIATVDDLCLILRFSKKTINQCLRQLKQEKLVRTKRIGRYTLFRVCGYKQFVRAAGNSCPSAPEASGRHPYTPEELESLRIAREGRSRQDLLDYSSCINREYYEEF